MADIRPQSFHKILYYFFTAMAIIGILAIIKDVGLILFSANTNFLTISLPPPYNLATVPIFGILVVVSWYLAKKHKKMAKDLKWR